MAKESAGILLYRIRDGVTEILLVHPGGPFWAKKDLGAWTIPKGEIGAKEEPLAAAIREFAEETGTSLAGDFQPLPAIRQAGGKRVLAWALLGDLDAAAIKSNRFMLEWPPRSGKHRDFPEVDKAEWFALDDARQRINKGQIALLDGLEAMLRG